MTESDLRKIAAALAPWHSRDELNALVDSLREHGLAGKPAHAHWRPDFVDGAELYQIRLSDNLGNEVDIDDSLFLNEACAKCASLKEELGVSIPELPKEFR